MDNMNAEPPSGRVDSAEPTTERRQTLKRTAEPSAANRVVKKPCIEVDLTLDDDDDLKVIKEEVKADVEAKSQSDRDSAEMEELLQARLKEIDFRRRALDLEREEAEVKRELQVVQRKKSTDVISSRLTFQESTK